MASGTLMPSDMAMELLFTQLEFPTATGHLRVPMARGTLMPLDMAMESLLTQLEFPTATGHLRVPMASGTLMPSDMAMESLLTQLEFPTATDHPREPMASVMLMPMVVDSSAKPALALLSSAFTIMALGPLLTPLESGQPMVMALLATGEVASLTATGLHRDLVPTGVEFIPRSFLKLRASLSKHKQLCQLPILSFKNSSCKIH